MENLADFMYNPLVIVSLVIGVIGYFVYYVAHQFKIEEEHAGNGQTKIGPTTADKNKKEKTKKKQTAYHHRADKQNFNTPWLLSNLKGHTGPVLNIDFSSNGKYLASCGEEERDMDAASNSGSSTSSSSRPSSATPSPITNKGLSRRQRKNRRRDDSSPDSKKLAPLSKKKMNFDPLQEWLKCNISEMTFYQYLYSHLLTDEQQWSMGYPVIPPDGNNIVLILNTRTTTKRRSPFDVNAREFVPNQRPPSSESSSGSDSDSSEPRYLCPWSPARDIGVERTCVRCGSGFFITKTEYLTQEHCTYHWGRLQTVDYATAQYSCCKASPNSPGCTTCKLHVWSGITGGVNGPMEGFVKTHHRRCQNPGVYALDCEMCFTVAGLEVAKVTVVGVDGRPVYDSFVMPEHEVVDYNTRFSGISEKDMKGVTKTLKQVQNDLRGFISAQTILIGHGLENDLRVLKLVHTTVVDTASSFPHHHGLPYRRSLKSLVAAYLKRDIQARTCGHNSYEDAASCMELMLYLIRRQYLRPEC